MDRFQIFIRKHFFISFGFFIVGILFGIIYSINLLGYSSNSEIILPTNFRSLHITFMLYGFIPLLLSVLPFLLIYKDGKLSLIGLEYLEKYFITWYLFLILAFFSLLFGVVRGLAFYDFFYGLNFVLSLAGVFYIIALFKFIKEYEIKPLWIKISLIVVAISPAALLILMNPTIGQVEATISGPHGDNTLGMSLALIPIYYLIIKLLSENEFKARWNIFWILPLIVYVGSIVHRSYIGNLSYEQEWFCQYLTLLYIPLLYRWYKDAKIQENSRFYLLVSILSFVFIDIEGNILFVPQIRWIMHRNDLIIAHAHIAMGISILFMVLAIFSDYIKELKTKKFYIGYLFCFSLLIISLSINGFIQAGYLELNTTPFWLLRTIFGLGVFISLFLIFNVKITHINSLKAYHSFGFLGDGLGILLLILFGDVIYKFLGFYFDGINSYIIYSFAFSIGLIHLIGFLNSKYEYIIAMISMIIRFIVGSAFISLFLSNKIGIEGVGIGVYDLLFAFIYLLLFHKTSKGVENV